MDSFIFAVNSTFPVFLVMVIGWVLGRLKVIGKGFEIEANRFVFKCSLPVMLFQQIAGSDIRNNFDLRFVLYCAIVTTVCFVAEWLLAELTLKEKESVGAFVQGAFRSSAAILGMAFIQNMYGDTGMAPLMIASAVPLYNIFSVLVLTFGSSEKYGGDDMRSMKLPDQMRKALVNIIKNPIIIGIVLGLPFSYFDVQFPVIVNKTMNLVSQTATPVALLCIGAGFKGAQAIKKIKPTIGAGFIKLVGQMLVFLPLAAWMGFRNQELVAIIIMLGSPATATGFVMAQNMGNDADLSSSIIVFTTLLSSVTLTLFIFICRAAGMI